jgi:hypothetical protein
VRRLAHVGFGHSDDRGAAGTHARALPTAPFRIAAWEPRISGRGGNAAPPSRVSR